MRMKCTMDEMYNVLTIVLEEGLEPEYLQGTRPQLSISAINFNYGNNYVFVSSNRTYHGKVIGASMV